MVNGGTMTVTHSTFSSNGSTSNFLDGGAIFNGGTLTVTNSTFTANCVGLAGGGICNINGTAAVINSTFTANRASEGGAIFNYLGALTVTNSTFSDNMAVPGGGGSLGGGIFINGTILAVTNSTFSGNVPGAIFNYNPALAVPSIKSTILKASSSGGNCAGTIFDAGYNISDDTSCGFSATGSHNNTNPLLDPAGLANNGGPTQTIALLPGSPALDTIPLAHCTDQASPPNPIITDQRLFPRPDPGGANCDIGAYDLQDKPFIPFSRFNGSMSIDPDAGVFDLWSGFILGSGSIDPTTQSVAFSAGNYAIRLPPGSFVKYNTGYVYQKTVNGIFLCLFIKFTNTPGTYELLANRIGGTLTTTASPVQVTLTIGNDSGSTPMNATFN
jgi:hypothetical protein